MQQPRNGLQFKVPLTSEFRELDLASEAAVGGRRWGRGGRHGRGRRWRWRQQQPPLGLSSEGVVFTLSARRRGLLLLLSSLARGQSERKQVGRRVPLLPIPSAFPPPPARAAKDKEQSLRGG